MDRIFHYWDISLKEYFIKGMFHYRDISLKEYFIKGIFHRCNILKIEYLKMKFFIDRKLNDTDISWHMK